jgi:ABC-type molybdate transport system ATPase subunit
MIRLPHIDSGFFDKGILRSSLPLKFLDTVAKWTHYRALNSPGSTITSSITNESVEELGLKAGSKVKTVIKSSDVMVAVD